MSQKFRSSVTPVLYKGMLLMLQGNPGKGSGISLARYCARHAGDCSCKELTISLASQKTKLDDSRPAMRQSAALN